MHEIKLPVVQPVYFSVLSLSVFAVSGAVKPKLGVGADSVPVALSDLRSHLPGIKTVTISAPGVLLEEWDPEKFEEGAIVKPDAAEIVKELASGMHVYILAHVHHTPSFFPTGDLC